MNDHGNLTDKRPPFLPTFIGAGFGSGFCPIAPGTAGSILATLVWLALSYILPADGVALHGVTWFLVVFFTLIGTWATEKLQPYWGDDPSRVVVDEMVGVWIPLAVVGQGQWWQIIASLVLFRFFDILKPFGIRRLDRHKGAFWVMGDDILGGIYALFCILIIEGALTLI